MADPESVSIVIPALDEQDAVAAIVGELRAIGPWREIVVIDDGSSDATAQQAERAGARVLRHPYTKGNGAAVKTGIRHAAGEFILIVDGDGQHSPDDARRVASRLGEYDLVVGARTAATQATKARRGGNTILNWLASYLTGRPIPDLTSGLRGARRECLQEFIHLLPNGFSTPTTTTLAFIKAGYSVAFEPVAARPRIGRSKIRFARDGAKFFLILLKVITLFSPLRVFLPISASALSLGIVYGAWTAAVHGRIPNGAVLLILFGVVVFLVGLISDQIASLRFEGPRR